LIASRNSFLGCMCASISIRSVPSTWEWIFRGRPQPPSLSLLCRCWKLNKWVIICCAPALASFLLSLSRRSVRTQFTVSPCFTLYYCLDAGTQHTVHDSPPSPRVVCCFLLLLHPLSFFNIYRTDLFTNPSKKKNTLCEIVNPMHHQINMRRQRQWELRGRTVRNKKE
jgi:hypothetical protein